MTAIDTTRDRALRTLGAWTHEHYAELMQALDRQAERCDQRAVALVDEREAALATTMRESAGSWRALRRELRDTYRAVPDEEHGPGYRPDWGDAGTEG